MGLSFVLSYDYEGYSSGGTLNIRQANNTVSLNFAGSQFYTGNFSLSAGSSPSGLLITLGTTSPHLDYFVASESKTGDYYYGSVVDTNEQYVQGSGFTSSSTDQLGGKWSYYVYSTTPTTLPSSENGYVLAGSYYDADLGTTYAPYYSVSGTNFLGTDVNYINVNGTFLEYGGGGYVVPDVKIDYFIASESKTGDYYLGYVIDDQGKYSTGSGFTSSTTDNAGGQWTYYVYNTAATTPDMKPPRTATSTTPGIGTLDASTGYTPYYAVSGTNFLGTDVDYITVNGSVLEYGGGSYVVPDVKIDYFIASESATGDYYLGYVIDDQGKYSTVRGFTSTMTDQAGGKWTYYVYATNSTTANLASQNGYVYDTGYWDASVSTGYTPYYAVSDTNFLGTDTDWIVQNGQLKEYGQEYYVAGANDPLLLSLDKQDISLLPAGTVSVDVNGTGQTTPIGWMGSNTGTLVLDTDGKGILGSGTSIVAGFSELDPACAGHQRRHRCDQSPVRGAPGLERWQR